MPEHRSFSPSAEGNLIPPNTMHHLFLFTAAFLCNGPTPPKGRLVIVGGGPTSTEIVKKTLSLAGGEKAKVLIIPQASVQPKAGEASLQCWRKAGAKNVAVLDLKDGKAALKAVKEADLIWMPGGSQSNLMAALNKHGLAKAIRDRYAQGATVGGTSAGAAVMSEIMLIAKSDTNGLTAGVMEFGKGLGLCPEVIIDQHFLLRQRPTRLLCAVLNHPKHIGIGIDECTAVVMEGQRFEVFGKSNVIVIDARNATKDEAKNGEPEAAGNVALHVLKVGWKYDFAKGPIRPPKLAPVNKGTLLTTAPK
jgi:cyanophycinase